MTATTLPIPASVPRLSGQRVLLRPYSDDHADAAALFALHADAEVMRWWSHAPWTSLQQAIDYLERHRHDVEEHGACSWAIALHDAEARCRENVDAEQLIGKLSLFEIDHTHRRGMVGYALLPAMQGRGYVREAMRLMLDFAWNTLDLQRIEADTDPENTASRRLLEHLGFRHEGSMRKRWFVHGEWHDAAWYGLLREDYR